MAIIANSSGMNSEKTSHENGTSSHAHDIFNDRQLQNKLLQADEDLDTEAYENRLTKSGNNVKQSGGKSGKSDSNAEDITGWFPSSKFVARKHDGAKSDNQNVKAHRDSFIHPWKDYRAKRDENFVFKHYHEPKNYIEQYRKDHGSHNSRYASGNQVGEMRRVAFQTTTPSQTQTQNAVQVSLQQIQQGSSNGSGYQPGLHYTNRKEQLGTLQVHQGSPAVCSCKASHADTNSQMHRYKLAQPIRHNMSRTNTEICSHHTSELSDNSSESGDQARSQTPIRRISSATSSRSNTRPSKSPTKITVPANNRAYPLHALTIQQNGKTEVHPQTKPLENLNCVAPEKQPLTVEKKPIEPLGVSLRVQGLHDLLTMNETRGYALPKSTPPNPVSNNQQLLEPTSSDSDTNVETQVETQDDMGTTPDISLDQLSTCALHAAKGSKGSQRSTDILHMFLQDPVLSRLNQRPLIKEPVPDNKAHVTIGTPKLFSPDAFLIPQNDVDAMLKVNMWNPIISQSPVNFKKEVSGVGSQHYRTMMTQAPFRSHLHHGQEVKPLKVHQLDGITTATMTERHDYFNPVKNIKLSITRVNNGVSFCRTQFQDNQTATRKGRSTSNGTPQVRSANADKRTHKDNPQDTLEIKNPKTKLPMNVRKEHPTPIEKRPPKVSKVDPSVKIPLPKVKIFESVPMSAFIPSPVLSRCASDLHLMDGRGKGSSEQFRPVYGSAKITGRNSIQHDIMKGVTTSAIVDKVVPNVVIDTNKEMMTSSSEHLLDTILDKGPIPVKDNNMLEVQAAGKPLSGSDEYRKDKSKQDVDLNDKIVGKPNDGTQATNDNNKQTDGNSSMEHADHNDGNGLNGIIKMFQTNQKALDDSLRTKVKITPKEVEKTKKETPNEKNKASENKGASGNKGSKVTKKPAVASGMWFDASGRAYVSLATRYDPVRKNDNVVFLTTKQLAEAGYRREEVARHPAPKVVDMTERLRAMFPTANRDLIGDILSQSNNDEKQARVRLEAIGYKASFPQTHKDRSRSKSPAAKSPTKKPTSPARRASPAKPTMSDAEKHRLVNKMKGQLGVALASRNYDESKAMLTRMSESLSRPSTAIPGNKSRSTTPTSRPQSSSRSSTPKSTGQQKTQKAKEVTQPSSSRPSTSTSTSRGKSTSPTPPNISHGLDPVVFPDDTSRPSTAISGNKSCSTTPTSRPQSSSRSSTPKSTAQQKTQRAKQVTHGSSKTVVSKQPTGSGSHYTSTDRRRLTQMNSSKSNFSGPSNTVVSKQPTGSGSNYTSPNRTIPKGPDPSNAQGPNKYLLLDAYTQARGPNPELCQGPDPGRVQGSNGAMGPDRTMHCGPKVGLHQGLEGRNLLVTAI